MPTPRETILTALHARLSALPATALRGEVLPERVPAEGLLILRDGEPGEPEVTLSPLRYHYQHRAEIEAVVQGADRDAAFDTLTASIGAALAADRTLVTQAINGEACEMEFAYLLPSGESFTFTVHAVYLPRPRIEISGPQGVQATFDWQAARDSVVGRMCTATLVNDVETLS